MFLVYTPEFIIWRPSSISYNTIYTLLLTDIYNRIRYYISNLLGRVSQLCLIIYNIEDIEN